MRALDLFNQIRKKWPTSVVIGDGYSTGSGYFFPQLNAAYGEIEIAIDHSLEHWEALGQWSFFQAVHLLAKAKIENGCNEINLEQIPLETFDQFVRKNLDGEGWENERYEYIPSL